MEMGQELRQAGHTLYKIFGTITMSSASSEGSFSHLKLPKLCLRSTMYEVTG